MYPTEVIVPVVRQAISAGRHCAADSPIGFSRKRGTPAWAASSSTGPRANGGVQTKAASSSRQRTLATSVTISQPGWLLASADARTTSTSHATLTRWPSWDALRACCSPIRPQPKIATRSGWDVWSMDMFGQYGATDLAHLGLGHHGIERQGLLDPLQGGGRDCFEQCSFVGGPSVEPRLHLRRRLLGDDFDRLARNPRWNLRDEPVLADAVDDHPAPVVREDGADHRHHGSLVPILVAHREAGRRRVRQLQLARDRLLQPAQEVRSVTRGGGRRWGGQSEVLQGKRADPPDVLSGDAEDAFPAEHLGQPRQQVLPAVLEREDEAAMVEPGVLPLDVPKGHPQHAARLDHRGEGKLAEANALARRAGPDHRGRGDAQRVRQIEHPGVRA